MADFNQTIFGEKLKKWKDMGDGTYAEVISLDADSIKTVIGPVVGLLVDRSGTIAAGGEDQTLVSENLDRKYFFFQNISDEDMWVNLLGGVAAIDTVGSIRLQPGQVLTLDNFVFTNAVTIISNTTGSMFTAYEGEGI